MHIKENRITIIGAGLTGMTLAFLLKQQGITAIILESRGRLGGRIKTVKSQGNAPIEMGATWFNSGHTALISLLELLQIERFEQAMDNKVFYEFTPDGTHQLVQIPPNSDPSFRVKGGTGRILDTLADSLDKNSILLNHQVNSVKEQDDKIEIQTNNGILHSDIVISTLPPYLLNQTIEFEPTLSPEFSEVANNTHTWMGESIKIGLRFKVPFWRAKDSSGTVFSNNGPVTELYDHSNYEDKLFALKGFLNSTYSNLSREERISIIIKQLTKYYGDQVKEYVSYEETVWSKETFTHTVNKKQLLPHQNNGNPIFRNNFYNRKFIVAGSETSPSYGGYMEGAIRSAIHVSKQVGNLMN